MTTPVVALVGRPNVGKSMLFNRIVGHDTAIVSEEAGTTRDRHFARAEWQGREFFLVDTGGITDDDRAPLDAAIRHQVEQAIDEADLLLMVVDGKTVEKRVHTGRRFGEQVEVTEGVAAGDQVIVQPGNLVAGEHVTVVN